MSESYKNLVKRSIRGSLLAKEELNIRKVLYINTNLLGISNETIVYRYTKSMDDLINYINSQINNIKSNKTYMDVITLDAFSSATIEGARTTVEKVRKNFNCPKTKSDKMVVNTIKAQHLAYSNGITNSNIRNIWNELTDGVCENISKKGKKYRDGMVFIGSSTKIVHEPEKVENIEMRMNNLFEFYDSCPDTILKACIVHFYFVYIHPFCDGNGRFARLWMNKILFSINTNFKDLVISRGINESLTRYYSSIEESEFSYNNMIDITPFIEYMLDILASSVDYMKVKRYTKLSDLDNKILRKLNKDGMTISKLSKVLNIDSTKIRYSLNKLVDKKFLNVDKSSKEYRYFKP